MGWVFDGFSLVLPAGHCYMSMTSSVQVLRALSSLLDIRFRISCMVLLNFEYTRRKGLGLRILDTLVVLSWVGDQSLQCCLFSPKLYKSALECRSWKSGDEDWRCCPWSCFRNRVRDLAEQRFKRTPRGDVKPNAWTLLDFGDSPLLYSLLCSFRGSTCMFFCLWDMIAIYCPQDFVCFFGSSVWMSSVEVENDMHRWRGGAYFLPQGAWLL